MFYSIQSITFPPEITFTQRQFNRPISRLINNSNNYLAKFRFTAFYKQSAAAPSHTHAVYHIYILSFYRNFHTRISSENPFFLDFLLCVLNLIKRGGSFARAKVRS
uniref:(northern house mosquito) hypothetical protein n=1 Tax=Culex pipiens TaxID=7175 RepID=A0A8D8DFL7_CULPI